MMSQGIKVQYEFGGQGKTSKTGGWGINKTEGEEPAANYAQCFLYIETKSYKCFGFHQQMRRAKEFNLLYESNK